jgi:UDP-glucose 4-epimerase
MNYKGKKVIVTGYDGFIGSALVKSLADLGADVLAYGKDIRGYQDIEQEVNYTIDYMFHFAGPSSQVLFNRNPEYCADVTINGFLNVARACRKNGTKLIYPSTGVLSQGPVNEYARCKKILEDIHLGSGLDALGLRIFAGYGPGEGHKRDYASVPYLFTQDFIQERQPIVFGTGRQTRDFIYIDDLVRAIMVLAEEATEPIIDVGSGKKTSFNGILDLIAAVTKKMIQPIYVKAPENYVHETFANTSLLSKYNCLPATTIAGGISNIIEKS